MHEYAASVTATRPIRVCVYTALHRTSSPCSAHNHSHVINSAVLDMARRCAAVGLIMGFVAT